MIPMKSSIQRGTPMDWKPHILLTLGDHPNGELSVRYTIEIGQPKPSHLVAPSLATWDNDPNWQSCVALSPTDSGGPGNTVFMHYKNTEIVVVTGMMGQC